MNFCQISWIISDISITKLENYTYIDLSVTNWFFSRDFLSVFYNQDANLLGWWFLVFADKNYDILKNWDNIIADLVYNSWISYLTNISVWGINNYNLYCFDGFFDLFKQFLYYPIISLFKYFQLCVDWFCNYFAILKWLFLIFLICFLVFYFLRRIYKKYY